MGERFWLLVAGISGFIAVAMGAAGSHLVPGGSGGALAEKASYYQMVHTLAILVLATHSGRLWALARWGFLLGIALFCGGFYLRAFGLLSSAPFIPLGGICFMLGWVTVAFAGLAGRR